MTGPRTAPAAIGDVRHRILIGDALERLGSVPTDSVDQIITSPPYYRLRDYGVEGQLGVEPSVDEWVERIAEVATQAQRVLVSTGTLWLNLGDSYSTHRRQGAEPKSLLLAPERVAQRLTTSGWILRNKIVWAKPNPVPSSVRDRFNTGWEIIFVFARSSRYFFDLDAVRQPHLTKPRTKSNPTTASTGREAWRGANSATANGLSALHRIGAVGHPLGKNPGDVWTIANPGSRDGHHATFPLPLAERMVLAGSPEARCVSCRLPYRRAVVRQLGQAAVRGSLRPTCVCRAASEPGLILDPFMGSGTTAMAAERHGRDWVGIELNPDFARSAKIRIASARTTSARQPIADRAA